MRGRGGGGASPESTNKKLLCDFGGNKTFKTLEEFANQPGFFPSVNWTFKFGLSRVFTKRARHAMQRLRNSDVARVLPDRGLNVGRPVFKDGKIWRFIFILCVNVNIPIICSQMDKERTDKRNQSIINENI